MKTGTARRRRNRARAGRRSSRLTKAGRREARRPGVAFTLDRESAVLILAGLLALAARLSEAHR